MPDDKEPTVVILLIFSMLVVLSFGWTMFVPMHGFMGQGWFGLLSLWPALMLLFFGGVAIVGFFLLLEPREGENAR